jgi:signal transduction histidine kinase
MAEIQEEIPESWWTQASDAKPFVFALLIATGLLLEFVIHFTLHISIVYTQFFYLIVVVAGLWYQRKAILVALFFGGLQIFVAFLLTGFLSPDALLRAVMLCVVAVVVGSIVEHMNAYRERLKKQNMELYASQQAFQTANRKLNLLSSITRHDIFNQLIVLRGYVELSKDLTTDPELQHYIERERNAADTIYRQIAFTKDYEEIGIKSPQWQDIGKLVTQIETDLVNKEITISIDPGLPEIYADPLLKKIFENLIDNSIRHGDHAGHIHISCRRSDHEIVLIFEDDGIGIKDCDKKRIFEKGFGKNTGLGLFISKEILVITGLSIEETGICGHGARFEIHAPQTAYRFS